MRLELLVKHLFSLEKHLFECTLVYRSVIFSIGGDSRVMSASVSRGSNPRLRYDTLIECKSAMAATTNRSVIPLGAPGAAMQGSVWYP
jgi:hypothetical protein